MKKELSKEEKIKKTLIYLGEDYASTLKTITKKDIEYLNSLSVKEDKSYLVYCSELSGLKKFVVYYLHLKETGYTHRTYDIKDFVDSWGASADVDLLILYYHKFARDSSGGSGALFNSLMLSAVASRQGKEQPTLILAEKELKEVAKSGLLNIISLDQWGIKKPSTQTNLPSGTSSVTEGAPKDISSAEEKGLIKKG